MKGVAAKMQITAGKENYVQLLQKTGSSAHSSQQDLINKQKIRLKWYVKGVEK